MMASGFSGTSNKAFFVGFLVLVVDAKAPDQLAAPVAQVDEQIIQTQQEHERGQDDREDLQAEQHVGEEVDEYQAHLPVTDRKGWADRLYPRSIPWTKLYDLLPFVLDRYKQPNAGLSKFQAFSCGPLLVVLQVVYPGS
ncbi:hypothetical protein PPS11_35660 [Pseudomonas putida S11]|nr:hypothetical protein PPS11_35660 [Pseudomonas putida S11]